MPEMLDSFIIFPYKNNPAMISYSGIILGMCSANERRRYIVTRPLIDWDHTEKNSCYFVC